MWRFVLLALFESAMACGASGAGYEGLAVLFLIAIPFLPVILPAYGVYKLGRATKHSIHNIRHTPERDRRRELRRLDWEKNRKRRSAAIAAVKDPKALWRHVHGCSQSLRVTPAFRPLWAQRAAAFALLGRFSSALKDLETLHRLPATSPMPEGLAVFEAWVRGCAGDYAGALRILFNRAANEPHVWQVEPPTCRHLQCSSYGLAPEDPLATACVACQNPLRNPALIAALTLGPLDDALEQFSFLLGKDLALVEADAKRVRVVEKICSTIYDAALSINSRSRNQIMWRRRQLLLLRNAHVLAVQAEFAYLSAVCKLAMASLAMGEQTVAAVRSDAQREAAIVAAKDGFFAQLSDVNDKSKPKKALTELSAQCELFLSTNAPLDHSEAAALFEPWESLFFYELAVENHKWEPTFFSKLTWCEVCGDFVKSPLPGNGSQCAHCHRQKHPDCAELVVPCTVLCNFTPQDRRHHFAWQQRRTVMQVLHVHCPQLARDVKAIILDYCFAESVLR